MFCMNCGTKLPDQAKFCFRCGARVPEGMDENGTAGQPADSAGSAAAPENAAAAAPEETVPAATAVENDQAVGQEPALPEVPGSHMVLLSKYHIDFPEPLALRRQLWRPFNMEGERRSRLVYDEIQEKIHTENYTDPAELAGDLSKVIFSQCGPSFTAALEVLIDHGVEVVSKDDLMEKIMKRFYETDLIKGLMEDKAEIARFLEQLGLEKEANKAHWQGGGFGISGAISGAVKAGMLNMAQDGLSALGRTITGNTYDGRARKFIRERLDRRDYPSICSNITENIISVWLVNEIVQILVEHGRLPAFSFATKEVKSRMANIDAMLKNGRYTKDMAMQAYCDCLPRTGSSLVVYRAMVELMPEAIPDVLEVADKEGEGLSLALALWHDWRQPGSLTFPDWVACLGIREGYAIKGPEMMAMLRYIFEQYPEGFADRKVLINGSNLTIPFYPELENISYYGFGENLQFDCDAIAPIDFAAKKIRFYHVHFAPPYAATESAQVENRKAEAQKALDGKDLEKAAAAYQAGADMGDAECMYRLGLVCRERQQPDEAAKWLQVAAEMGEADAAWEYFKMTGQKDGSTDYTYLFKAADAGHGKAGFRAGQLYEAGTGLPDGVDFDKAAVYYEKAAARGVEGAEEAVERVRKAAQTPAFQTILFKDYQKYKDADEDRALAYLRRCAARGHEEARRTLAAWDLKGVEKARESGDGTDWAAVCALYEEAASCGSPEGCYGLALLKESGKGTDCDKQGAASLFLQSAQAGYGPACVRMGQSYEGRNDPESAFQWYRKGAASHDSQACLHVGLCYAEGTGCEKDLAQARKYLSTALQDGIDEAAAPLSRVNLACGDACQADGRYEEALECYEEAAAGKNAEAMLKAARLRGNEELDGYDYTKAMAWYDAAAALQPETEETKKERICLKAAGSFAESLEYMQEKYGGMLEGTHYHLGDDISSGLLDNVMKAYGGKLEVEPSEIFLVCDAANALFWGKGKKGFLITKEGDVCTSQGEKESLNAFSGVHLDETHSLQSDTGFVFCTFADSDYGELDESFAKWLTEEVILSEDEYATAKACGVFEDEEEAAEEAEEETDGGDGEDLSEEEAEDSGCGAPLASASPTPHQPGEGPGREELRAFTEQLARQVGDRHYFLYCAPEIPPKKLTNALTSYAKNMDVDPADVLVLCDSTVRGSARDGFLLTWDRLISSSEGCFALKDMECLEPSTSNWTGHITAQPGNRKVLAVGKDKELTWFCEGLNRLLKR